MKNGWSVTLVVPVLSAIGCAASTAPPAPAPRPPEPGVGQEVVARMVTVEPKSYTDHLDDGSLVVSDVFVFAVLEPRELAGITVDAYSRRRPVLEGHLLSVGDVVGFRLPSRVRRLGILLWDLEDLRLLRPATDREARFADLEEGGSVTDRGITLTLHRKAGGAPDAEGRYPASSTGCGFSVLLPAPYDDFTSSAVDPSGEVLERHVVASTTAEGAELTVVCMASDVVTDAFLYPEQYALNMAAGDRVVSKTAITLGDLSGLEISLLKGDGGHLDARVLVGEERVYELVAEYPAAARQAAALARDAVFASFTPAPGGR